MSTLTEASPDPTLPTAFNKTTWQREYMRRRLQDPECRKKYNEYQRAYQKKKRAPDPAYRERLEASRKKYRSKLQDNSN